jgi:hypothetical protein
LKKFTTITFTFILLLSTPLLLKGNIQTAKATVPTPYQGDLIINGDNITFIEGNFNINGSIIIEENATLTLKNAILNFTQTRGYQFNITLQNGNPQLQIENTTINGNSYNMFMHFYGNCTAKINKLEAPDVVSDINENANVTIENSTFYRMAAGGNSKVKMTNSLLLFDLGTYGNTCMEILNTTLGSLHAEEGYTIDLTNSTINYHLAPRAYSANLSVNQLKPDFFPYWNFRLNCSVTTAPKGKASNITLTNTQVNGWILYLWQFTNASITQSKLKDIFAYDLTTVAIQNSTVYKISAFDNTNIQTENSTIETADLYHNAKLWLTNSKNNEVKTYGKSQAYIAWLIKIHVIDSINQNVPLANVTATYPNATTADTKLTDTNGTTKLKLIEKIITANGEQTIKTYTIKATYETHTANTTIDITQNKEITMKLENLIVPESPLTLTSLLLLAATTITLLKLKLHKKH